VPIHFFARFPAAARTKLRKLLADKAKAGSNGDSSASAGKAAADRSPHAKSSYDAAEFETLVKQYEGLKWRMISKPGGATVKPDDFYRCMILMWPRLPR